MLTEAQSLTADKGISAFYTEHKAKAIARLFAINLDYFYKRCAVTCDGYPEPNEFVTVDGTLNNRRSIQPKAKAGVYGQAQSPLNAIGHGNE